MMFNNALLVMDDGQVYSNNEKDTLRFILNGDEVKNPYNNLIKSEDQLLIAYGEESLDDLIFEKFANVSDNAGEYNAKYDPGSCSGTRENSKMALVKQLLTVLWGIKKKIKKLNHRTDLFYFLFTCSSS